MESNNRNLWIIVAVIVVAMCCCMVALAAAGAGWFATRSRYWTGSTGDWTGSISRETERSEETYAVGDAPSLKIDSFAGNITVRAGQDGNIRVVAIRKALSQEDLDRIKVVVAERDGGLTIKTEKPARVNVAMVELEITAPAGTRLKALSGAGNVETDGIVGEIEAQTGAGDFDVRGATVCARLDAGAGSIRYQGTPQGSCRFETGAGNIALNLPASPNVQVDLQTGTGRVDVDYDVAGEITGRKVKGIIGSGAEGTIYARTGAGNIDVARR